MSSGVAIAFGKAVRERRLVCGLSQEDLAHEADVHRTYISMIERGIKRPTIDVVFRLATALQTPPGRLIDATEALLGAG